MTYIPFENKVSLINKYIQINILQNRGKKEHVNIAENTIFSAIIDDLKKHNETITQPPKESLQHVLELLKTYQGKQADMRFQLITLMNTLETFRNEDSDQINLEDIIQKLKELEEK